jgi:hypothetical protein
VKSAERLIKNWKKGQEEIATLEMLATKERPKVAEDLGISYDALSSRIITIKKRVILMEWYLKEVNQLKRISPYIVGLLAPSRPDDLYSEE